MKTNTEHYISLNENLESELEQILLNIVCLFHGFL